MTTDTPLNLNKPTMDLADLRHRPVQSITASTLSKELQEAYLRSHLDDLRKELAASNAKVERLHTENVCLQELIQEFYEWTRRDYPTEAEVRDIMNRYYNLLNK